MIPTAKLRWLDKKTTITAEQVHARAHRLEISLMQAKAELMAKSTPVLQQWWNPEVGDQLPEYRKHGEWRDIELEMN